MRYFSDGVGTTLAMMLTMAVGSASILAVAVSAPDAAPDIGVRATHVGIFTGLVYFVGMFSGSFCTGFIVKYGPVRVLQISAIFAILGLAVFTLSTPLTAVLCAILLGCAYGPINPANAPVLLAITNTGNRAFMFSIKQSGVTVGGTVAAVVVPLVVVWWHWKAAILTIALLAIASLFILEPMRARFDRGRIDSPLNWSFSAIVGPVGKIMKIPLLRGFSLVGFVYAGVQLSVASFFVVYLVERGFDLVSAGLCFLFVNCGGIAGRVAWGGLSDKWLSPKTTLMIIGIISVLSICGMFLISQDWNTFVLYTFSFVLGASTHGWNGVFLSEVANQAPVNEAHIWTGGVQFLIYGGVAVLPPIFGAIIVVSGGYSISFTLVIAAALCASLSLPWLYQKYTDFR